MSTGNLMPEKEYVPFILVNVNYQSQRVRNEFFQLVFQIKHIPGYLLSKSLNTKSY